jgi:superfamily II DNA or RNA helicase
MALSTKWLDVLSYYAGATIVGATATPWRTDKQGLADVFDGHVVAATVAELMDSGALVYCDYFAWDAPDLHEVRTARGDYNQGDLEIAANTEVLVGNACEEYAKRAKGRRALTFAVSIAHSENLVSRFRAIGIRAQHVDCNTPRAERAKAIVAFERREIEVLSSVDLFSVGFDCPPADTALLCRPTKSLPLHLQQVGRVLRPYEDKIRALVLDHSGNLLRHGFAEDDRDMTPGPTPQSVIARRTCPCCFTLFSSLKQGRCPSCGELIAPAPEPREESKGRKQKEEVDGKMIDAAEIARIRGKGLRADLSDRQALRAANATTDQKKAEYRRLVDICRDKNIKIGWAAHRFRETFGHWPRYDESEIATVEAADRPFFPLPPRSEEKKPLWQSAPSAPSTSPLMSGSAVGTSSEITQQEMHQMKLV